MTVTGDGITPLPVTVFSHRSMHQTSTQLIHDAHCVYRQFLTFLIPDQQKVFLIAILSMLSIVIHTILIWIIGSPIDLIITHQTAQSLPMLGGFILALIFLQLLWYQGNMLLESVSLRFLGRLRNTVLNKYLLQSENILNQFTRGDMLMRISSDTFAIKQFCINLPLIVFTNLIQLIFFTSMLIWINPTLSLYSSSVIPLLFIHQYYFPTRQRRNFQALLKAQSHLFSHEEQAISHLQGIGTYSAEYLFSQKQRTLFIEYGSWSLRCNQLSLLFGISFELITYIPVGVIALLGLYQINHGSMSPGQLVSFLLYLGYLAGPISGMSALLTTSQQQLVSAQRVREILDLPVTVRESLDAPNIILTRSTIQFDHVGFAYPEHPWLFDNLNFQVHRGEFLAITGTTGCGKSTLIKLLLRFHDPLRGQILIDRQSIDQVNLVSLRQCLAVVHQTPFLIDGSIRDNLLLVSPQATDHDIQHACELAQAWEFIHLLPERLATRIGASGIMLSTGQCQRLSLAQAFLKNTPILILDEATSALDSKTEKNLLQAIDTVRRSKTIIAVAHRMSTIHYADRCIALNQFGNSDFTHVQTSVDTNKTFIQQTVELK